MNTRMTKQSKNQEKVLHIRLEKKSYNKLVKEAKTNKRSLPLMARFILENRYNVDFTDKELYKMQSVGGVYSDLKDEEDIYTEKDIKPVVWD